MRRISFGSAVVLFGFFASCSIETGSDEDGDDENTGGDAMATGGETSGGSSTGGKSTGGKSTGGKSTGGAATGGAASGGASTGGAGASGEAGNSESGQAGASGASGEPLGLSWPIDCVPDETCVGIGYPDTDKDGVAHDCGDPGYEGHEGTDIGIPLAAQLAGTTVRAAADGEVLFAFDGKYDQCPNDDEPDCRAPESLEPGAMVGTTVCTPIGDYCGTGEPGCFWCFAGGNAIVIRHQGVPGVFATRYDHLKKNSVLVQPGDVVTRGQKIAEAGSAGNSTGPHLHFEVWGTGFYELADPWAGECGPNTGPSLWAHDPPWSG
jgi:murein DD-endopeptidase MepM/ murein hydrolase activator NlpD